MRKSMKVLAAGIVTAVGVLGIRKARKKTAIQKKSNERVNQYYDLLLNWIDGLHGNRSIAKYLKAHGYQKVAIYGNGTMGFLLYEELKKSDVIVEYFIDKNAKEVPLNIDDIQTISMEEIGSQRMVDAIIVTPIHVYDSIKSDLEKEDIDIPILSLDTVVLEA